MRAWHFVGATLRDGRSIPADGVKLHHEGEIIPCALGLHASLHPFDALQYAPGATLCLVECEGEIRHHGNDKLVCQDRTILARMDATPLLKEFARMQALSVAHLWKSPDVVLEYLMTGDDAARDAARDADWAAAWDDAGAAARAAARDAAWAAARDAARAAAWAAAWAAARDAAWAAAWDAARDATRDDFQSLVNEAFCDYL